LDLITDPTASATDPGVPTLTGGIRGFFVGAAAGTATRVRYWWLNMVAKELVNLLTKAAITPDPTNSTQVYQAIQALCLGGNVQTFAASGNWTVPAGVTACEVEVWGDGGGSGGSYGSPSASQAGGGGGYAKKRITGLTPATVIAVTVGPGGAAGVSSASPTAGTAGTGSSFGAYVSATGGGAGAAANGSVPSTVSSGGTGVGGDVNLEGSTGDTPFVVSGTLVYVAKGGTAPGVPGAHAGFANSSVNGTPGPVPGCGASGSADQANGAAGGAGLVIVRW
jgi:hypothetical protein